MTKMGEMENRKLVITRLSRASWFKIESRNLVLHFDPGYTGYFQNQGIPLIEIEDKADLILITHFHKDHLQPEAINRILGKKTVIVATSNCVDRIKSNIIVIKPGDSLNIEAINIRVVDAYNTKEGHSTRKVHHRGNFVGYLVSFENGRIYFAGDTDHIPEMKNLGKVDIAFLPIGGTFVMDIEEAVNAVMEIKPRIVIPMHQSKNDPEVFKKEVLSKTSSEIIILNVGSKAALGLD
jgi:L-ascorbate metabolism protein UlaG (beta-lactamase superfamily)